MSLDCDQGLELTPDFRKLKAELSLWAKLQRFPLSATWELTPLCNLRCPMCYVRLDPKCMAQQGKPMPLEAWLELGRQTRDMGTLFLTLTGGEPLLHPDFWTIYNALTEMGLLITIYTNGCLINEDVVERLKANPPHNIKMSIYGASNETYEKMCGVKDGFTRVSHAVDLLKESGLNFYCTCTVVHENMHDFDALYRFAAEKQIKFYHTTAVALSARGALSDPLSSRTLPSEVNWTLESLEKMKRPRDLRPFAACAGYTTAYFMTWHGHMQFCGFATKPYVQFSESASLKDSWNELFKLTEALRTPAECETCEHHAFCKRCPGLLAAESGDPEKISRPFCEQAEERHRIYNELMAKQTEKTEKSPE